VIIPIFVNDGKYLCWQIGSVAGFEDGPFETSQLHSPASTSFHAETNCLFIADCEVLPHGSQNLLDPGLGLRNKYIVAQT
jgi:hypothetical protein